MMTARITWLFQRKKEHVWDQENNTYSCKRNGEESDMAEGSISEIKVDQGTIPETNTRPTFGRV